MDMVVDEQADLRLDQPQKIVQCNAMISEKILSFVSSVFQNNTYLGVDFHVLSIYLCKRYKNGKVPVILGSLAASAAFEIR